jgi:prophage maintenance system killer protein
MRGVNRSCLTGQSLAGSSALMHPTLHEMAAAYLVHITPFVDGNERVGPRARRAFGARRCSTLDARRGELRAAVALLR